MKMKKSLIVIFFAICLTVMVSGCDSLSNLFSRDLNLKMVVENTDGLHENSLVNLVKYEDETCIGMVRKMKSTKSGNTIVYISIDRDIKDQIREGALFMVNRPLFTVDPPSILIDVLPKNSDNPPLDSGTIVYETSYTKYSMMLASDAMRDTYGKVMKKTDQFLSDMEEYFNSEEFDELLEEFNQVTRDIASFTAEQKEHFENEILPKLKEKIDETIKEFDDDFGNNEKKQELEKEMERLKNTLKT